MPCSRDFAEADTGVFVDELNAGTDPRNADPDGDGLDDGIEVFLGSNPIDAEDPPQVPLGILTLVLAIGAAGALRLKRAAHAGTF